MFITPAKAVAYGAQWLDECMPEWATLIDLNRFDIMWPQACIMGQLVPGHDDFVSSVMTFVNVYGTDSEISEVNSMYASDVWEFARVRGFEAYRSDHYSELDKEWRKAISERM